MKLKDCLELGEECGMTTIEECYNNVDFHATMLFKYEDIGKELLELQKEFFYAYPNRFCMHFNATIEELLAKGWEMKQ